MMMRRLPRLAAALALLVQAAPAAAQLPTTAEARRAAVEHGLLPALQVVGRPLEAGTIRGRMEVHRVPAVSVAVIHEGRIDWAMAWGLADVAEARPATPETLFQAASMSKPLAALAALTLVDAGELSLDADVNRWLDAWKVPASPFAATHPVTLRGLLSHTAGITVHGFPGYTAGLPIPTTIQVLDGMGPANTAAVRLDTVPGSRWRYSGGGYTIVQQLLTDVTGSAYPELLRTRVLVPLGMRHTTSEQPLPSSLAAQAATGYRGNGSPIAGRFRTYPEMAAAGLWTTPTDYARYVLGIQRALRDSAGGVLSRALAETMMTPVLGGYGLGVAVSGAGDSLRFSHGGANEGFRSIFTAAARHGGGVVVMTNSDSGAPLAQEIMLAVARVYGWPGLRPMRITPAPLAATALDAYVGRYAVPGLALAVSVEGERLLLAEPREAPLELVPVGTDTFVYLGGGRSVRFERDAAGRVLALRLGNVRLPRQ